MKPTLYIDIETIPGPENGKGQIEVKPPANYKKEESIRKWLDENADAAREEIYRAQSFDGGYGQICAISWAIDEGEITSHILGNSRAAEKEMLAAFIEAVNHVLPFGDEPEICGHYVSGFDLRFIKHRCIIHGVKMPHWLAKEYKPWDMRDTMTLWAGARDRIGLDELCRILGIPGKGDMDGSKVYDAWLNDEHDKISEYCAEDVERVRQIDMKFQAAGV